MNNCITAARSSQVLRAIRYTKCYWCGRAPSCVRSVDGEIICTITGNTIDCESFECDCYDAKIRSCLSCSNYDDAEQIKKCRVNDTGCFMPEYMPLNKVYTDCMFYSHTDMTYKKAEAFEAGCIKIIATVTDFVQVGEYDYRNINTSIEVKPDMKFSALVHWYEKLFPKKRFHINEIEFSQIDEDVK